VTSGSARYNGSAAACEDVQYAVWAIFADDLRLDNALFIMVLTHPGVRLRGVPDTQGLVHIVVKSDLIGVRVPVELAHDRFLAKNLPDLIGAWELGLNQGAAEVRGEVASELCQGLLVDASRVALCAVGLAKAVGAAELKTAHRLMQASDLASLLTVGDGVHLDLEEIVVRW
jgi:hypothetical protein